MLFISLLWGCNATCSQACKRLMECESVDTTGVERDLCEEQCRNQESLYEEWEDEELQERLDDARNCIRDSTCPAIADGVCYDEELFPY